MRRALITIILIGIFIIIEWQGREYKFAFENIKFVRFRPIRWFSYTIILLAIYFCGNFNETVEFIYFQF